MYTYSYCLYRWNLQELYDGNWYWPVNGAPKLNCNLIIKTCKFFQCSNNNNKNRFVRVRFFFYCHEYTLWWNHNIKLPTTLLLLSNKVNVLGCNESRSLARDVAVHVSLPKYMHTKCVLYVLYTTYYIYITKLLHKVI